MKADANKIEDDAYCLRIAHYFAKKMPHGVDLNLTVISAHQKGIVLKIPYQEFLLGDTERNLIHGGVITSLIDSTSGAAALCAVSTAETIATLDLRVDHMRPGIAGKDIYAWARCYRITHQIAFVRSVAYQDRQLPLATSSSTFMRASSQHGMFSRSPVVAD